MNFLNKFEEKHSPFAILVECFLGGINEKKQRKKQKDTFCGFS